MVGDMDAQMILAEWLFVETVADVRRRSHDVSARSRYELLGVAPLLRKLLLDRSTPLVSMIRKGRPEVPLEFRIRPWSAPTADAEDKALPWLSRLSGPEMVGMSTDPVVGSVQEFVSTRVGLVDGEDLTVCRVVRYYSHVEGGVHFGEPREPGQATLTSMAPLLLGHSTGQIAILAYIGQIVVDALTPLCDSILSSPTIDRRVHRINEAGFYDNHWTTDYFKQ